MEPSKRDVYDEEFATNLQLAKTLIDKLGKSEQAICKKWITKLCDLKSTNPMVKKNRNHFFQYFLQILYKTSQGTTEPHFGFPQYDDKAPPKETSFMSRWSPDKRTYVAAQPLPGRGTLIYMAVAKEPTLGWDVPNRFQKT